MMTVTEALDLVDNILARVSGNREDHVRMQIAMNVIREAAMPKPETPKKAK